MTLQQIEVALAQIRAQVHNPEAAHSKRDDLWLKVLRAISQGAAEPGLLATAALQTETIPFPRWTA